MRRGRASRERGEEGEGEGGGGGVGRLTWWSLSALCGCRLPQSARASQTRMSERTQTDTQRENASRACQSYSIGICRWQCRRLRIWPLRPTGPQRPGLSRGIAPCGWRTRGQWVVSESNVCTHTLGARTIMFHLGRWRSPRLSPQVRAASSVWRRCLHSLHFMPHLNSAATHPFRSIPDEHGSDEKHEEEEPVEGCGRWRQLRV